QTCRLSGKTAPALAFVLPARRESAEWWLDPAVFGVVVVPPQVASLAQSGIGSQTSHHREEPVGCLIGLYHRGLLNQSSVRACHLRRCAASDFTGLVALCRQLLSSWLV